MARLDLGYEVRQVGETFRELAEGNGFALEVRTEDGAIPIQGSAGLIARAISNLVDNALKYSQPPGPVRLSASRKGALAVVEVADEGPGVPAEHEQRIFAEFARGPQAASRPIPGSGLGLAVTRQVARAHGGTLSMESSPHHLTTFRLSFLLARSAGREEQPRGGTPEPASN
ncbi:MAG: sensor histidine kinase [Candidatus Dormibacteria bacterium]